MANCVTDWVFRRQRFCCCLPVRLGAVLLSFLSLLLAGLLMIIIWFEVATNYVLTGKEKAAFIVAGLVETFLFIASVLGFIGACARKQSFVTVFAIFLYIHFFINLAVAIYFLWMITHAANVDVVKLCRQGIQNSQAQGQCTGLLNITTGVYWGVSFAILSVEAYCTLVVTRYVNQLRYEKRDLRHSRMLKRQGAYNAFHLRFASATGMDGLAQGAGASDDKYMINRYSALSVSDYDTDKERLLDTPFDPYEAYEAQTTPQHTGTPKRDLSQRAEMHHDGKGSNAGVTEETDAVAKGEMAQPEIAGTSGRPSDGQLLSYENAHSDPPSYPS